jgi:two-component system, OmpR family, copper resistance phosphate regulon response regulator CusR
MRLLIVEDQVKMAEFLKKGLTDAGYEVDIADSSNSAENLYEINPYDMVVLDVGLPDRSGLDCAKSLRSKGYTNPILMLTAYDSVPDRISGLDAGADDYLTKPFSFEELLARVRAQLRRKGISTPETPTVLKYASMEMDLINRKVKRNGLPITLTTKEFALLEYFLRNPEVPLSRAQIAKSVWDLQFDSESNVIDVYVNFLRKKIDVPPHPKLIQTVVGIGYIIKNPPETTPPHQ